MLYCHPTKACYKSCVVTVKADPKVQEELLDLEGHHRENPGSSQTNRNRALDNCVGKHIAYPCVDCEKTIYSSMQIGKKKVPVPPPLSGFSCGGSCIAKQISTRT